ncbi:MYB-like protein [Apiospora arundinis]|uniref:Myb-like domain-containing protein n=1 Tax=Apiospora arundinis TaxID=335852 RepID=A0ABR2J6C4_9PEZI
MLMPSALSCDSSRPPMTRLQAALFASPPASPPTTAQSTIDNIFTTCRSLQSMLTAPAMVTSSNQASNTPRQLPTPPMAHASLPPPLKLRLRSHKSDGNSDGVARKRVVKRTAPSRGINKRRRATEDDMGRDNDIDSDLDIDASENHSGAEEGESAFPRPATPKRARLAPEVIPLGLERSDFHNLQTNSQNNNEETTGSEAEVEADGEMWSTEDDRILVELVLEKLKLTKSDWQDCARSLGKDRSSIGRRWKSLMVSGDVGLKTRSRRGKLHGTWR